jgi:hypothetical protein
MSWMERERGLLRGWGEKGGDGVRRDGMERERERGWNGVGREGKGGRGGDEMRMRKIKII